MAKYLNPKVDLTFKKVFGEHPNLVKSLLNALLPLPEGMTIEEVEYVAKDVVPNNLCKKYTFIFVRCRDCFDRIFIVEVLSFWNMKHFLRTLSRDNFVLQKVSRKKYFGNLELFYSIAFVGYGIPNGTGTFENVYLLGDKDVQNNMPIIVFDFDAYKRDRGSRAIKELWLRFLTEIDESTKKADDVLLENPELNQALEILETSAYTDADLYVYNDALLEIMTQRNAMKNEREDGYAEGEAKGRADEKLAIARKMLSDGMSIDLVAKYSGLTPDEIAKI